MMHQKKSAPLANQSSNLAPNATIQVRTRVRAFTLIELLVVIVIVGILATISVASFNEYHSRARDARRQANISSISKILTAYTTLEEKASHMKQTCDTSGENIEYADSHYGLEGNVVPDNSHAACLVKYLKEQGVSFPDPASDCYVMFYETASPENFLLTSVSEDDSEEVFFVGNSPTRGYVDKDGENPFDTNYNNLKNYAQNFATYQCQEYGLNGLSIYTTSPFIPSNPDSVNLRVEPLDPRYFE